MHRRRGYVYRCTVTCLYGKEFVLVKYFFFINCEHACLSSISTRGINYYIYICTGCMMHVTKTIAAKLIVTVKVGTVFLDV